MRHIIAYLLVPLLLIQCGKIGEYEEPLTDKESMRLILFAAPWCANCNEEIPDLHHDVTRGSLSPLQDRLKVSIFVETASSKLRAPTVESAEAYRQEFFPHVDFEMQPDIPPGFEGRRPPWTSYISYMGEESKGLLPAAVALKENGDIIRVFRPGNFKYQDLVNLIEDTLSETVQRGSSLVDEIDRLVRHDVE